ncbi:hypothetical protein ACP4OV_018138 [Aristida adscensionis]
MGPASNAGAGGHGEGEGMAVGDGDGDEHALRNDDGGAFPANFAEVVASLPLGPHCPMFPSLRLYRGFWVPEVVLLSLPQALCFAAARRAVHPPSDDAGHPLLRSNSHDCVRSIDTLRFLKAGGGDGEASPRILSTHLPYSLLPASATADGGGAGCRIIYVSRDPKDTLVSLWHFNDGVKMAAGADKGTPPPAAPAASRFEEAFELYCQGRYGVGPQWEHARGYWEAARRSPERVLCLKYEEMLRDPAGNLKRMAAFMGCPFLEAEEDAGVVRAILELCTIDKQRSAEVNKSGAYVVDGLLTIGNKHFYRKGTAGDWRNHMTPEMAARLDSVVYEALKGSGFTFGITG